MDGNFKKPALGIEIKKEVEMPEPMGVTFKAPEGVELPTVEEGSRFNMEAQFEKVGDQIKLVSFGGVDLDGSKPEEKEEMSLEDEGNMLREQLKDEDYE